QGRVGEGKAAGRGGRPAAQGGRSQRLSKSDCAGRRPGSDGWIGLVDGHTHGAAGGIVISRVGWGEGYALRGRSRAGCQGRVGEGKAAGRGGRPAAQG